MFESKDVMHYSSKGCRNAAQKIMTQKHLSAPILDETLHTLRNLSEKGSRGFDCSERSLSLLKSWTQVTDASQQPPGCGRQPYADRQPPTAKTPDPQAATESIPPVSLSSSAPVSADSLELILTDMGDCRRCNLATTRTHIVFGAGNPSATLMFVGEAPGFDEDRQGLPFVGKAGQLLSRIIQAMNLTRDQVYICNVIKCRPPGNRNPVPDEILACSPFLNRQIATISPKFICALGTFAAQTLLKTTQPISRLRGQFHDYSGIRLLPTFHPSYLLRNPDKKREVWEDMKLLMNEMMP